MAEVEVRETPPDRGGGTGCVLALVVLVLALLLGWYLLARDDGGGAAEVELEVPQAEAPALEVPERIDARAGGEGREP